MVSTGYVALWFGPMVFLPLFVGIGVMRAMVALGLPAFRAPADAQRSGNAPRPAMPPPGNARRPGGATKLRQVMRPLFLLPLVGTALVHASHLNMNAFQSLI